MTAPIAKPWLSGQPDQDPRTATGARLRWGVIATGGIAAAVTRDLELLPDAELYAVSSRTQAAADAFAADYGFARAYGDDGGQTGYQRLLADEAVDVVYVATPHAHHHEIALAALNAGKHVLCEKALTVNAREAERTGGPGPGQGALPDGGHVEPLPAQHAAGLRNRRLG